MHDGANMPRVSFSDVARIGGLRRHCSIFPCRQPGVVGGNSTAEQGACWSGIMYVWPVHRPMTRATGISQSRAAELGAKPALPGSYVCYVGLKSSPFVLVVHTVTILRFPIHMKYCTVWSLF